MPRDPRHPAMPLTLELDGGTARSLATALKSRGFDKEHLDPLLDVPQGVLSAGGSALLEHRCRASGDLGTLVRLFVLSLPVELDAAAAALAPLDPIQLADGGLLEINDSEVLATVQIQTFGPYLVVSDRSVWYGESDFVLQFTPSAHRIASAALFPSSGRVLDLCCGAGMLGVVAADLGAEVVAADLNPRAAMFTRLNAALNGVAIDARVGDMFAPVEGERFDLVVSNPPFIISPDDSRMFLTGRHPIDGFCRSLAGSAVDHLTETGVCQFLAGWAMVENQDPDDRVGSWFDGFPGDVWTMEHDRIDIFGYAASYLDSRAVSRFTFDQWIDYYRGLQIEGVVHGLVTMQRSSDVPFRAHTKEPTETDTPFRDHLATALRARKQVAMGGRQWLLAAVLSPGAGVSVNYHSSLGSGHVQRGEIVKRAGIHYRIAVEASVLEFLASFNGERSVGDAVAMFAVNHGLEVQAVTEHFVAVVEECLYAVVLQES